MPHYELFHPDTEILGQVLAGFEDAVGADVFGQVLENYGMTELDPEAWYPGQSWVDVLNAIAELPSSMLDFVSLGIRQIEQVEWPPEFHEMPLAQVLASLEGVYRMNYRGTDVGSIRAEVVDDQHVKVILRSFEPDDLWYGNIYGITRVLGDPAHHFTVYYDEELPRREQGGDVTVIHVEWEDLPG